MSKPSWADPRSYVRGWDDGYQAGRAVTLKDAERERDELRNEAVEAIRESERLHALNRDLERENERLRRELDYWRSAYMAERAERGAK